MVLKKREVEQDVWTASLERVESLYRRFDRVAVSFSGGKDSTVALQVALEVARARNALPLEVYFFDEEAIHPETIEYVQRVAGREDVLLSWYTLQVKHRNACSRREPWWYCWDDDKRDLWCRPMPEGSIHDTDWFQKGMTMPNCVPFLYPANYGRVVHIRGLRAAESLSRYRSVTSRERDNWMSGPYRTYWSPTHKQWELGKGGNDYFASPVYDWSTLDVWTAPRMFGWDYNRAYDVMSKAGIAPHDQRVCPPYGEEPLRGLYQYAACWPELWDNMVRRVHGAATAARYARTTLYGYGDLKPPEGLSWQDWFWSQLAMYAPADRKEVAARVARAVQWHRNRTGRAVPQETPDPATGMCWAELVHMAIRGDIKGRTLQNISAKGGLQRAKTGQTYEEAVGTRW